MKSLYVFLFIAIVGALAAEKPQPVAAGGDSTPAKFIPIEGIQKLKLMTIAHSTQSFFDSWQQHDMGTTLLFVNRHSQFLFNTLLPPNGYYSGKRGYLQMFERWFKTVSISDAKYRILFVDEARGYSAIEYICSGEFRHNNAKFDEMKLTMVIKWEFGKISKLNVVEMNPHKTNSLFQTKANKQWNKIMDALYSCDAGCTNANEYIADDVTITLNNLYPVSLLAGRKNASSSSSSSSVNPKVDEFEGKDVCVTLKGKDNAVKFAKLADKLYFDLTIGMRVLYTNENTVVAAKILKPAGPLLPMNKKMFWNSVTVMYTINRFNENGLLREVNILLNRPLSPVNIRRINQHLDRQYGETFDSLVEPLREVAKVEACRA